MKLREHSSSASRRRECRKRRLDSCRTATMSRSGPAAASAAATIPSWSTSTTSGWWIQQVYTYTDTDGRPEQPDTSFTGSYQFGFQDSYYDRYPAAIGRVERR